MMLAVSSFSAEIEKAKEAEAKQAATKKVDAKKTDSKKAEATTKRTLEKFTVLGTEEDQKTLGGSGKRISGEEIKAYNYSDIHRILRKTPGVYIREEDGFGLFPNIALRGVSSNRSEKLTILEDGVPTQPAPYSAPAAYYSPNAARMSAIEVLKGSSNIAYGPHTTGGVLNYITTEIPEENTFKYKQLFGSFGETRSQVTWGDTYELEEGRLGVLLELFHRENEGFKDIQNSTTSTGIKGQTEPMLKLRFEPNTAQYQYFEFKAGYTALEANETYVGLTDEDFANSTTTRYWGTQWDNYKAHAIRTHLRHFIELNDTTTLQTTAYYQKFHRNWSKLGTKGSDLADPAKLALLKGTGAGDLKLKNNNRDYRLYGVMTELNHSMDIAGLENELKFGARIHTDSITNKDSYDTYNVTNTTVNSITRSGGDDKREETDALSFYIQDAIHFTDKLIVTPGIRFEHMRYMKTDFDANTKQKSDLDVFIPGVSFSYLLTDETTLFGGIHKGINTPSAGSHVGGDVTYEQSMNYELGARYTSKDGVYLAEVVAFLSNIDDMYDKKTIISDGSDKNVGKARTYGLELSSTVDVGRMNGWSFSNPWFFSGTFTQAQLETDTNTSSGFYKGGRDGNELPYTPEFQATFGTGAHWKKFGTEISASWVDETYSTASNDVDPGDYSVGKIDSHIVVDWNAYYHVNKNLKLTARVENLLDETYVASRHAAGSRPGKPQSFLAGFELTF